VRRQNEIRGQTGKNVLPFPPRGRLDAGRVVPCNLHPVKEEFDGMRLTKSCAESRPLVGVG